jgi:outer membrane protein insertion porin family
MIKFLLKIFLFYISFQSLLFSQIIENINVNGNKRFSTDSIIVFSSLKIGSQYNNEILNESLKKLFETNFFEDVKIIQDNNTIIIDVIENPIINTININGIKKKNFLDFLRNSLSLNERSSFNITVLDKDLIVIKNILKINGYYFSKVDTNIIENKELNSVDLNISIELGNKAKINKINFYGNKVFKDKKLLEIITSEENRFWKLFSRNVYLNQNQINLDKNLLTNFYKNKGYYNIKVLDNYVELNQKDSSFNLIYNIDAGEKFFFNNFKLNLPEDYIEEDFSEIDKIFNKNIDKYYSLNTVNNIIKEIEKVAATRFYDFIDVNIKESFIDKNKVDIIFELSDSNKYYVERINIFGNYTTIEEVIRNQLSVDEGDPLNNVLLNKSIDDIRSTGIFKKVEIDIKNGSSQNLKMIDITVEEQPTGEISLAAGYGTTGFASGFSINEKNFLGKGVNLNSSIELTSESIKGEITYSQPNFAYTDNSLFTSFKSTSTDFLSIYGYKTDEIGSSIGTKYEVFDNVYFSPNLDLSFEKLSTNQSASSNLKKQEGNYNDLYFNYGLEFDSRDSSFDPRSGSILFFNQDLPLITDSSEILNTFIYTTYKAFSDSEDLVGRSSLYFKSANSFDDSDVRISKRVNVPYNRLRGFERGKVGPVDNNDYIGGNYASALNLSTNLPSLFPTIEILDFNYFIDIANTWGVDYDSSLDNSKIRSSTGIGLNVITPIGPLSFTLAQPITKTSSDKTENFRFNLGTTF